MSSDEVVLYEAADGVATLTFNRPARLNAWNPEMEARYFDLLEQADDDPGVRVLVVTGAGRGFCAGMDSALLSERANSRRRVGGGAHPRERPMSYALTVRKPMIAAVNGGCAGIGFLQALYCDVRFAASDAKLATAFTRRGLPPEFGSTWLLARIVGAGHAADLMLSGRAISGADAEAIGLVNRAVELVDLLPTAYRYARDVAANCSPRAIAYAKADMRADWSRTFAQAELDAVQMYGREGHAADFAEGINSYVEKRPPRFEVVARRRSTPPPPAD